MRIEILCCCLLLVAGCAAPSARGVDLVMRGGGGDGPSVRAMSTVPVAAPLRSPFAGMRAGVFDSGRPVVCPAPPPPYIGDMEFPSKYEGSDKSRSSLNPVTLVRYKFATRDIETFEKGVAMLADRHARGESGAAACGFSWLAAWAGADALARGGNAQGDAVRKWALGAAAFAYLRLREGAGTMDLRQDKEIRTWLGARAEQVVASQSAVSPERVNNHQYWSATAVAAVAVALDRRDLYQWSLDVYRQAAAEIDQHGMLPRELARGQRALFYHNYALTPLVMLADIGLVNGDDLLAEQNCALCRLVDAVLDAVDQRGAAFRARTGADQLIDGDVDGHVLAWLAPLAAQCPDEKSLQALARHHAPLGNRRLGGNLGETYRQLLPQRKRTSSVACRQLVTRMKE